MNNLNKILESKTKIQYQDCDPFNHLNNSKYIDYILAARTEQLLEQYDFNAFELATKYGIGWVTAQTQITYFIPARWMEEVTIESRLINYSNSSILVEANMWNSNKTQLKSTMWVKLVHFDIQNQCSKKHDEKLMEFFEQIIYKTDFQGSFEDRIKLIKQNN